MSALAKSVRDGSFRQRRTCRGTAATEFCVVLPVLIALAVLAVDLGRAIHTYIALSNAARRGAEQAATHKFTGYTRAFWEDRVREAVTEEMQLITDFDDARLSIDISTEADGDGLFCVTVETRYHVETIVDWIAVPPSIELWRSVTMRQIR
jgi:Flp pilus assembly protein TadG